VLRQLYVCHARIVVTQLRWHPEDARAGVKDHLELLGGLPNRNFAVVLHEVGIGQRSLGNELLAWLGGHDGMLSASVRVLQPVCHAFVVFGTARFVVESNGLDPRA